MHTLLTRALLYKKTPENTNQRFQVFIYTYSLENTVALNRRPRLFFHESQSKQQH